MVRAAPASSAARAPAAPAVALLLLALVAQGSARPVLHPGIWAKPDYSVYHNRCSARPARRSPRRGVRKSTDP